MKVEFVDSQREEHGVQPVLQMAIWRRHSDGGDLTGLVHHSDRGVQSGDPLHPAAGRGRRSRIRWQ
jgi:hypothetical protein